MYHEIADTAILRMSCHLENAPPPPSSDQDCSELSKNKILIFIMSSIQLVFARSRMRILISEVYYTTTSVSCPLLLLTNVTRPWTTGHWLVALLLNSASKVLNFDLFVMAPFAVRT